MNKAEFVKQLPHSTADKYPLFEKYQSIARDALFEFDRVCRKNGLKYYLAWGTLLGAIRDGGQIPWDYDADVFIKYHDKDAVIKALQRDLLPDYYCECPETNEKSSNLFIRIAKKGILSTVIHLDVFYLVPTCDDKKESDKQASDIEKVTMARSYRNMNVVLAAKGDVLLFCKALYRKLSNLSNTNKQTFSAYEKICSMYGEESTSKYLCGDREAVNYVFEASIFDSTVDVPFESRQLMAPVGYKQLLTQLFKDYYSYPSEEQQIKEYLHSVRKFEYYEKYSKSSK